MSRPPTQKKKTVWKADENFFKIILDSAAPSTRAVTLGLMENVVYP